MAKVITFGELMLRLAPENYLRFVQSDKYEATFGGAEANVSVSLANYGVDVAFVTKLPAHEIGQAAVNSLRKFGVDTSKIVRGGERVGIYYCEKGASQRPSKVIYDRAYSSIAMAKKEGWFNKTGSKWQTMPQLMLHYRAAAFFQRTYAPEISMGLMTSEEIQDIDGVDTTTRGRIRMTPEERIAQMNEAREALRKQQAEDVEAEEVNQPATNGELFPEQ